MRKSNQRFISMILLVFMVLSLTACSSDKGATDSKSSGSSATPVTLKLGTTVNENDSFQIAAVKFADLVKERTKGTYAVEIYPNGKLGDERTMLESMQMGTLDMGIITSGPFANFAPEMGVLDMPFLFSSNEQAYKVLDGGVGQELLGKLDNAKLKGLAYAERGFRNLTNSKKAVTSAADAKGLKIRVMENPVYTATFNALGVNAVPMAWSEALTGLQQGTIDGQENPVNVLYSFKLWESQKHVTMTRHAYSSAIITMSLEKYNKLPKDVQAIIKQSAQDAAVHERAWVADNESKQIAELKKNGMQIVETPNIASFKTAVQPVYNSYPQYADYLKRIQDQLK